MHAQNPDRVSGLPPRYPVPQRPLFLNGYSADSEQRVVSPPGVTISDFSLVKRIFLRLPVSDSGLTHQCETRPFRFDW